MIFFIAIPLGALAWAFAIAKAAGMDMSWWFCLSPIWVPIAVLVLWYLSAYFLEALDKRFNRE